MTEEIERETSIGQARYACHFYEAAVCVDDNLGQRKEHVIISPITVYYLIGHSLELIFKAFLLDNGARPSELKNKLGHNLAACLEWATEYGIRELVEIEENEIASLTLLNEIYSSKEFEYMVIGFKTFPTFGPLQSLAKKLIVNVCRHVGYRAEIA